MIHKDYELYYERLLEMANTTSLGISRLCFILFELYESIHQLNTSCINDVFK